MLTLDARGVIFMNNYFIDLLEKIKTEQMSNDIFSPDICYWESARSWASRYSNNDSISDECVLDLLYFFYTHENLDFYDNVQFDKIAKSLYMQYGIGKGDLLKMFSDFRKLVYEV